MKTCERCFREFYESEADVVDASPATEQTDIMFQYIGVGDINDLWIRGHPQFISLYRQEGLKKEQMA